MVVPSLSQSLEEEYLKLTNDFVQKQKETIAQHNAIYQKIELLKSQLKEERKQIKYNLQSIEELEDNIKRRQEKVIIKNRINDFFITQRYKFEKEISPMWSYLFVEKFKKFDDPQNIQLLSNNFYNILKQDFDYKGTLFSNKQRFFNESGKLEEGTGYHIGNLGILFSNKQHQGILWSDEGNIRIYEDVSIDFDNLKINKSPLVVPMDLSSGKVFKQVPFLNDFFIKLGMTVYPLTLLILIAILVFFVKLYHFMCFAFIKKKLLKRESNNEVISKALASFLRVNTQKLSFADLQELSSSKLSSWLYLLSLIATISPLVGLLGTVTGIIQTFEALNIYQSGAESSKLSGGISEALLSTMVGLMVAIPSLFIFTLFKRYSEGLILFINNLSNKGE